MRLTWTDDGSRRARTSCAAMLALGLALAGVWTNTVGNSTSILPSEAASIVGVPSADAFRLGRLFAGIVLIVFARRLPSIQKTTVVASALLLSMGTGALVLAYHQTLIDPSFMALAGIFLSIACYSFLVWVFYRQFARRLPTSYAVWGIASGLVLEAWLSSFVCLVLPPNTQIALAFLLPPFIAAAYYAAFFLDSGESCAKPFPRVDDKAGKLSLVLQVVLITVALVFVQALSDSGVWGESRGVYGGMDEFSVAHLVIVAAVILGLTLVVFWLPRKRLSLSLRCIVGFGVILLGMQMLALINDSNTELRFPLMSFGIETFSHLVRWLMVIECVRLASIPSYRIAGIANVASALVGLLWIHFLSSVSLANSALVMVTVYLLLMCVIAVFIWGQRGKTNKIWASGNGVHDDSPERFADRYSLSPRESEIFELLVQGLKYAEIEERCQLSSGTVKTHVSNLYKKLDVHSRKEMKDLYNDFRTEAQ